MVKIDWNAKPYVNEVRAAMERVAEIGAKATAEDASRRLESHFKRKVRFSEETHSTGELASQIEVKASQFKDGGWVVVAQGPGNYDRYYASFVELGTSKMEAIPYLRPALRRNKYRMRRLTERELGAIVR